MCITTTVNARRETTSKGKISDKGRGGNPSAIIAEDSIVKESNSLGWRTPSIELEFGWELLLA